MAAAAILAELPPVTALTLVRTDDGLTAAEALVAQHRYAEARAALEDLWGDVRHDGALALRQRLALGWVELYSGELVQAERLFAQADAIAQSPHFDAADRAEVAYRQGCVALKQSRVSDATALLTRALETNERSTRPRAGLAARAHEWRSRCHLLQRDWDAAQRDVERSLELATAADDVEAQANALFQASIVSERASQWLTARCYGEQALDLYHRLDNPLSIARVLNNLGGISFLLGDVETAERMLFEALEAAAGVASDADLAQAVNSLAQVYLRTDRPAEARARALRAVELLEGRADYVDELGNALLVVAQSLQAEGEPAQAAGWLDRAEDAYTRLGSTSHLASVWVARGDLSRSQGDVEIAADHYRRAATALQDVHF